MLDEERGGPSADPSDALLITLGLLSVELPSSVDRELFLDTIAFLMLLDNSSSWLSALKREDLAGHLVSSGELKGEDSVEEVVSLSSVACQFRVYPLGESLEVRLFRLNEEGEVEGETLEHTLDRLLGISRGEEPGSEWKSDSFLLQGAEAIAGLSSGHVRKGQGGLALGIRVGGLLIAAAIIGALVHTLHLDDVWVHGLIVAHLYFRARPLAGRRLDEASGSALIRVLRLLQGWKRRGDAELWDVVRDVTPLLAFIPVHVPSIPCAPGMHDATGRAADAPSAGVAQIQSIFKIRAGLVDVFAVVVKRVGAACLPGGGGPRDVGSAAAVETFHVNPPAVDLFPHRARRALQNPLSPPERRPLGVNGFTSFSSLLGETISEGIMAIVRPVPNPRSPARGGST
ncbi:hypothetical protein EYF80_048617 [Liparis tanakae]|uniref:Uncharacterized protein n=1 Tax=Liparis tanakae TaxID=230148 RepID=A0A4Z2FLQ5_9TELE|nr:hypothetical protein EYF80_048617 [Liparis tanakae]